MKKNSGGKDGIDHMIFDNQVFLHECVEEQERAEFLRQTDGAAPSAPIQASPEAARRKSPLSKEIDPTAGSAPGEPPPQ